MRREQGNSATRNQTHPEHLSLKLTGDYYHPFFRVLHTTGLCNAFWKVLDRLNSDLSWDAGRRRVLSYTKYWDSAPPPLYTRRDSKIPLYDLDSTSDFLFVERIPQCTDPPALWPLCIGFFSLSASIMLKLHYLAQSQSVLQMGNLRHRTGARTQLS